MKPILCHECKKPINQHGSYGLLDYDKSVIVACKLTPSDIAAHAVQAAVSEAVEVIKRLTLWVYREDSDGVYMYCYWCESEREAGHAEDCPYVAASAYLAAHQDTTPQDVDKCICVDILNSNPDPVVNPDCPIHGTMWKADARTVAERTQDEFAKEVIETRESDRPL